MVADKLPAGAPHMRQCTLVKKHAEQEYGFNLHAEKGKGNFIGDIDDGGPADVAGLHVGDHIVAVNKNDIANKPHHQVVQYIKSDPLSCELLVIDEEALDWYKERGIQPSAELIEQIDVVKAQLHGSHRHGTLRTTQSVDIEEKQQAAPATTNGHAAIEKVAEEDDVVLPANPVAVAIAANQPEQPEPEAAAVVDALPEPTHEPQQPNPVEAVIQANQPAAEPFAPVEPVVTPEPEPEPEPEHAPPHSPEPAVPINVVNATPPQTEKPLLPKLCVLQKKHDGQDYGFNLHAERDKGHFIGAVDTGSVADQAGLVMRQRIVGINGALIYPTSRHSDVVELIRQNPQRVELLVAAPEVDEHYRERSLSYSFDNHVGSPAAARAPAPEAASPPVVPPHVEERQPPASVASEPAEPAPVPEPSPAAVPEKAAAAAVVTATVVAAQQPEPQAQVEEAVAEAVPEAEVEADPEPVIEASQPEPIAVAAAEAEGSSGERSKSGSSSSGGTVSTSSRPSTTSYSVLPSDASSTPSTPAAALIRADAHTAQTNGHHSSSTDTPTSATSNGTSELNNDVFKMSAAQAREKLSAQSRKKRDPRKTGSDNMTLEEKYRIVSNM